MDKLIKKDFGTNIKEIEKKGIVIIAANAFNNVDRQNDVSLPGSFTKTIKNIQNIYWYKNHNSDETLGIIKEMWEDNDFLNAKLLFNLNKEISINMYSDYKFFNENGSEVKHSVMVSTTNDKFEIKDGVRYVKEWDLWEISSLTKWPANPLAGTHDIKSLEHFNLQNHLSQLEQYYGWISKNGIHTDNFIFEVENKINKLKQLSFEQNEKKEDGNTFKKELLNKAQIINHINNIKF